MRRVGGTMLALVLALGLARCGEDAESQSAQDAYCTQLRHFDDRLSDTDWRRDPGRIAGVVDDLEEKSPRRVRQSWKKYAGAFRVSLRFLDKHLLDPDDPPGDMSLNDAITRNRAIFNRAIRPVRRARPHAVRISRHAGRACDFQPSL